MHLFQIHAGNIFFFFFQIIIHKVPRTELNLDSENKLRKNC